MKRNLLIGALGLSLGAMSILGCQDQNDYDGTYRETDLPPARTPDTMDNAVPGDADATRGTQDGMISTPDDSEGKAGPDGLPRDNVHAPRDPARTPVDTPPGLDEGRPVE